MAFITTRNRDYEVDDSRGIPCVVAQTGPHVGRHYRVDGYFNESDGIKHAVYSGRSHVFSLKKEGEEEKIVPGDLSFEEFYKILPKEPLVGKRMVATLLEIEGDKVQEGDEWDMIVTSPIREVRESRLEAKI
ncbi:MAG: hypothetical protein AABW73_00320 [Nanoarchaeota archaeon]